MWNRHLLVAVILDLHKTCMTKKYYEDFSGIFSSILSVFVYEKTTCKVQFCSRLLRLQDLVKMASQHCGSTIHEMPTKCVYSQLLLLPLLLCNYH